jgi:hypothetical protein
MKHFLRSLLTILVLGCGQTGGEFVEIPFEARGTAPLAFVKGGWEVTLSQATLGFGPIYFCTTDSAISSRCEVAVLEFLDGVTLDGLDPSLQSIGTLFGTTGTIRTAFFDYGIVWLLTEPLPKALAGVPGGPAVISPESSGYVPQGYSARFLGTAACVEDASICCPGATSCPVGYSFEANVDVLVVNPGTPAVNGVRTSQEITTDPVVLTMTFDPDAWWQTVDFARLAALDDGSGEVLILPGDPDYSALIIAMTANELPTFTWSTPAIP